jgi:fluoroquinolone resistance protein
MARLVDGSFLRDQTLTGLDRPTETLARVELLGCEVLDTDLSGARLSHCVFEDVTFRGCDLSLLHLGGSALRGVRFIDCKLTGMDWSQADDLGLGITLQDSVLDLAAFQGVGLKDLSWIGGRARDAVFTKTDLRGARLERVDLEGATFSRCDLRRADLSTCGGLRLDPLANRLERTKLPPETGLWILAKQGVVVPGLGG